MLGARRANAGGTAPPSVLPANTPHRGGLFRGPDPPAGAGGALMIIALGMAVTVAFGTIGLFVALRTGTGEAVQGLFPVFFVFLFLSSMALPLELIQTDWYRAIASANPVSYLLQAFRSLLIEGWNAGELALGFGIAAAIFAIGMYGASAALKTRLVRT